MPMLTNARHERYAQGIAAGKNATDAYIEAGYTATGGAARANASRLLTDANVAARIAELQSRVAEGIVLTKQWVIERLIENAQRAARSDEYEGSVVNRALELLGKTTDLGLFVERQHVTGDMTIGEPVDRPPRETHEQWTRRRAREIGLLLPGVGTPARATNGRNHG